MKKPIMHPKYFSIAKYTVVVFAICLAMVVVVLRFDGLMEILKKIIAVVMPIIWGLVFAYLLNPFLNFLERHLTKVIEKKKKHPRILRGVSAAITVIVTLAVLSALIAVIIPQISDSIVNIFKQAEDYIHSLNKWLLGIEKINPEIYAFIETYVTSFEIDVVELANKYLPEISTLATGATTVLKNFAVGIKDFALGFIVMVYILCGKENFKGQTKKVIYAFFKKRTADNILRIVSQADRTFIGFIYGKALDSTIIGILCFIAMRILDMPFPVLISVIVGVTNMIPFFGPFIGAIPSAVLVFFAAPEKTIIFIIFIFILQQFDGNILGPKILGDSTGLPAFWVMFAIFIGGGLFGFVGMLVGVPVFAVIYDLSKEFINATLLKKNLPVAPKIYQGSEAITEISHETENTEPVTVTEETTEENDTTEEN